MSMTDTQQTLEKHETVVAETEDCRLIRSGKGEIKYILEGAEPQSDVSDRQKIEIERGKLSARRASFLWALHARYEDDGGIIGRDDRDALLRAAIDGKPALAAYIWATESATEGSPEKANKHLAREMRVARQSAKNYLSRFENEADDELPAFYTEGDQ